MPIHFTHRRHESIEYAAETGLRYKFDRVVGRGPREWWVKHSGKPWERVTGKRAILDLENAHENWTKENVRAQA